MFFGGKFVIIYVGILYEEAAMSCNPCARRCQSLQGDRLNLVRIQDRTRFSIGLHGKDIKLL